MTQILHTSTVHKTESLADDRNSVYGNMQFSGAHNIKQKIRNNAYVLKTCACILNALYCVKASFF